MRKFRVTNSGALLPLILILSFAASDAKAGLMDLMLSFSVAGEAVSSDRCRNVLGNIVYDQVENRLVSRSGYVVYVLKPIDTDKVELYIPSKGHNLVLNVVEAGGRYKLFRPNGKLFLECFDT